MTNQQPPREQVAFDDPIYRDVYNVLLGFCILKLLYVVPCLWAVMGQ